MALSDGLQRYYPLDGSPVDVHGGIDGVITGPSPTYQAGHVSAQALYLAASNSNKFLADAFGGGDFSCSFWIYAVGSLGGFCCAIGNMTNPGAVTSDWCFLGGGTTLSYYQNGNTSTAGTATLSATGVWKHVVVTRVGAGSNNCKIYVNGSLEATFSASVTAPGGTDKFVLVSRPDGFTSTDARMQEVALYNRGLSGAEAVELYNGGAGLSYDDIAPSVPPTVDSVSPSSGVETGGTAITITGTGFVDGATVTVGGVAATGVDFVSDTELTAITPAGALGSADVEVVNPDDLSDTLVAGFTFTVTPPVFTKYGRLLEKLLPPGSLWNLEGDSELHKLLLGAGDELQRVEDRGADLIEESDPRTATETIGDWEEMLGLPDEQVTAISAVLAERRVAVTQKLVGRTGQNLDFFERLCAACGYPLLSLTKHAVDLLRSGTAECGESIVSVEDAYTITLELDTPTAGALTEAQFERVIRHATHSHIQVVFTYT
jgi:uncharacterized protein YmfQ (DUF2313 family)